MHFHLVKKELKNSYALYSNIIPILQDRHWIKRQKFASTVVTNQAVVDIVSLVR